MPNIYPVECDQCRGPMQFQKECDDGGLQEYRCFKCGKRRGLVRINERGGVMYINYTDSPWMPLLYNIASDIGDAIWKRK